MKLGIKWIATIVTVLLIAAMFVETVPPTEKYFPVDSKDEASLFNVSYDHQWSIEQLTRSLLLVLYAIVVIMAIWVTPERSWLGLHMERRRMEQRAKIAEAEALIAKHKKDAIRETTNL
jgi:ABC-type uncharacterized transport system permease subunit